MFESGPVTEPLTQPLASLVAVGATLTVFASAEYLFGRLGRPAYLHPVLVSIVVIGGVLVLAGVPYGIYFDAALPIHLLLGPATVALALPIYRQRATILRLAPVLALTLALGSLGAMASGVGLAALAGADTTVLASLTPKSVTAPVAMELARSLGGVPALAAALVILTGTLTAAFGPGVLHLCGVHDPRAAGFAMGLAGHGIATAAALRIEATMGAYAGLGMALNAVMTTLFVAVIAVLI